MSELNAHEQIYLAFYKEAIHIAYDLLKELASSFTPIDFDTELAFRAACLADEMMLEHEVRFPTGEDMKTMPPVYHLFKTIGTKPRKKRRSDYEEESKVQDMSAE